MGTRSRFFFFGMMAFGVVIGVFLSTGLQRVLSPSRHVGEVEASPVAQQTGDRRPAERPDLDPEEQHTIALFKASSRSVAYITTQERRIDFWTRSVAEVPAGTGSCFVWDDQGHVVTNFHVVQGADAASVTLGQDEYPAQIVGAARDQDLALLRIKAPREKLLPIRVGVSDGLQVGQKVYAIGNPFGLDYSLTSGIVSALGRTIQSASNATIFDVIQTDAAINPGNSGGPLLDSGGRLIGVNTAIYSPSGASAGIGFAVPVDTVNRIIPELIAHGRVIRPVLGVGLVDDQVNASITRQAGVGGALIGEVYPGTGAAQAGLQGTSRDRQGRIVLGDIVQEIDGKPVTSRSDLLGRLGSFKPGDTVTLVVWRDGSKRQVKVRLQAPE